MDLRKACVTPTILGTFLLLTGCGGAQAPAMGGLPTTSNTTAFQPLGDNEQGCGNGDIRLTPCHVELDTSNPGPVDVMVANEGTKHEIKESDDCGGIATVTEVTHKEYSVAAGTTGGHCEAHFDTTGGEGNGSTLKIANKL